MADKPTPSPGWHLSANGLQAVVVIAGVLTMLIQSYFGRQDVAKVDAQVQAIRADVKEIKESHRPLVYGKE